MLGKKEFPCSDAGAGAQVMSVQKMGGKEQIDLQRIIQIIGTKPTVGDLRHSIFPLLEAHTDIWSSSWLYFIKSHHYKAFHITNLLFSFEMTPTFLAKVTLLGSSAPVLPILFRPWSPGSG